MMVAGTSNGFVTFSPNGMKRNSVKPRILFTALEVTGHPVRVGGEVLRSSLCQTDTIHLSYRDDAVRIAFSAMSLVNPQNCRYLYRLEGMEDEWNECGREPIATYTNLSPGTYRLHVRATNNDGVWCDDDAVLTIIVTPPFYWNTPVKILYVLLLAGLLLYGVRRLLRKRDAKHHAEIEQLNIQKEIDVHEARIQFMSLSEKDSSFLASVEAAIERHYADSELTVDLIASEVCVSRSSLFSRLKNISDATPNEMIQMIRLKHAAALLEARTDGVTVSEICYRVGFSSPSYFSKCFQKRYGCTPSEWQQKREL